MKLHQQFVITRCVLIIVGDLLGTVPETLYVATLPSCICRIRLFGCHPQQKPLRCASLFPASLSRRDRLEKDREAMEGMKEVAQARAAARRTHAS